MARRKKVDQPEAICITPDGEEDRTPIDFMLGNIDALIRIGLARHDGQGAIYVDITPEAANDIMQKLFLAIEYAKAIGDAGFVHEAGHA